MYALLVITSKEKGYNNRTIKHNSSQSFKKSESFKILMVALVQIVFMA